MQRRMRSEPTNLVGVLEEKKEFGEPRCTVQER